MNITIGKYRISSDPRNVSIHEVSTVPATDKNGKENKGAGDERLELVGHYGNPTDAFVALFRHDLMVGDARSIEDLISQIWDAEQRITECIET